MPGLVVDPSAILALALGDEEADYASAVLTAIARDGAIVPSIFWYELRNVLLMAERRNRLTPERTGAFLAELAYLPIDTAEHPPPPSVVELARNHRLTAYDAAYLELAIRHGMPLATLDRQLRQVASTVDVLAFEEPGDDVPYEV